jgi:small redox-active disulfide protein 2
MKIEILGPGCPKCKSLEENVRQALAGSNKSIEVVKITDINTMVDKGVIVTPALIIDGKIVSQGKLLSVEQIKQLIG